MNAVVFLAGSFGYCDLEPIVSVSKPGRPVLLYPKVSAAEALELVEARPANDSSRQDRALCAMRETLLEGVPRASDLPLFALQTRVALRNCGFTAPEDINYHITCGQGYSGLSKALRMDRPEVIERLKVSEGNSHNGASVADRLHALHGAGETTNMLYATP